MWAKAIMTHPLRPGRSSGQGSNSFFFPALLNLFAQPAWMASSTVLPSTVIDYANASTHTFDQTPTAKGSTSTFKLPEIFGSTQHLFTRRVESTNEEAPVEGDPEFKLPSLQSLFVVIGGNALFQVSELHT